MSDDDVTPTADDTTPDDTAAESPRTSSPAAQAASRARRIGGRPMPGPLPAPGASEVTAATAGKVAKPDKTSKAKAPKDKTSKDKATKDKTPKAKTPKDKPAGSPLARLGWIPAVVAAVLAAAMVGICVWQSHGVWWAKPSSSAGIAARSQVLAAAKTCGAAVTSYDYRTFPASEQAGLKCTTGNFTSQYQSAMEQTVKKLATDSQTVQTTQVAKAGIQSVSADGKQWVILVYGQQVVSNKTTDPKSPRLDQLSMQVTLDKVASGWLVANIQQVS